jgi:hypothetical protein
MLNKQQIEKSLAQIDQPKTEGTLRAIGNFAIGATNAIADKLNFHPINKARETLYEISLISSADYNAPRPERIDKKR